MSMSRQAVSLLRRLSRPAYSLPQPQRAISCDVATATPRLPSSVAGLEGDGRKVVGWIISGTRYEVKDARCFSRIRSSPNLACGKSFASMASEPVTVLKEAEGQVVSTTIAVAAPEACSEDVHSEVEGSQRRPVTQPVPQNYSSSSYKEEIGRMSRTRIGDAMSHLIQTNKFKDVQKLYNEWMRQTDARGRANRPDTHMINVMLQSMANTGASLAAMDEFLLDAVKKYNIYPSRTTYSNFLRTAFLKKDVGFVEMLLRRMENSDSERLKPHSEFYSVIIILKAADRRVLQAVEVLKDMLGKGYIPSRLAYSELLRACAKHRFTREAVHILTVMKPHVMQPLIVIFSELLVAGMEDDNIDLILLALEEIKERKHHHMDEGTLLMVLNCTARGGYTLVTEKVWDMLQDSLGEESPSIPCHLARMHAYAVAGNFQSAFRAVQELDAAYRNDPNLSAVERDDYVSPFTSLQPLVLAMSRDLQTLDQSYSILEEMHHNGEVVSTACLNAVILSCANLWDMSRGYETFEAISQKFGLLPDTHSYNALIQCFGAVKQLDYATKTFETMELNGLVPNQRTYEAMVDACICVKHPAGALVYLKAMVDKGYKPQREQLVRMYRRSQRENFQEGWRWTRATVKALGYRDLEYDTMNRRIINEFGQDTSTELRTRRSQLQG